MEDQEIIELFFNRDEQAIKEIEIKYANYCLTIARRILSNYEDCKECLNETYLKLWDSIPPNKPAFLSSYIGKIVRNLAFNKYNKETTIKRSNSQFNIILDELAEVIGDERYNPEKQFDRKQLSECINSFLSAQGKKKRDAFVLRYWHSYSIAEISNKLGIKENNVSVMLNRLRNELKSYLKERGFE